MTQTATVINFDRPVVKADLENGFTRIANELTEALMQNAAKLCGREFQIVHAVIHKTFRFHKKSDWISNSQISEMTGIAPSKISDLKKSLIAKNVLVLNGREMSVNTTVSEWQDYPKKGKDKITRKRVTDYPNAGNDLPEKGYKITPNRGTHKKTTNTKDNYTKDNCRVAAPKPSSAKQKKSDVKSEILALPIPTGLSFSMWKEWVECRSENKKPMTVRSAKMQISKLEEWHAKGHDLDDIVKTSIANNYQGLFEPKGFSQNNANTWQNRKTQNNIDVLSDFVRGGNHD